MMKKVKYKPPHKPKTHASTCQITGKGQNTLSPHRAPKKGHLYA